MTIPDLPELRAHLLRDRDGDGFPDALRAPVWIARGRGPGDVDAGVAAAAEFLAPLAERALLLQVDARRWDVPGCGFAIGALPPSAGSGRSRTWRVTRDGLVAHAPTAAALTALVRAEIVVGTAAAHRPRATAVRAVGLGALLHGDDGHGGTTPFAGDRDHPERFVGGFAPGGGVPEALGVALRLALAGRDTPERVCVAPDRAAVRTGLDPTLPPRAWCLRRRPGVANRFELVGQDRAALADACRWFASAPLATPDGQRLDDLEDALTLLVRGESRAGRLAAVAHAARVARAGGVKVRAAALPSPPDAAPWRLGVPVIDSARDGDRRSWSLEAPWEGDRLVDAAVRLRSEAALHGAGPVQWEAFASETLAVREELGDRLRALARAWPGEVEVLGVRHAFRPALHWLLEEVAPLAPRGARRLRIEAPRQSERYGPSDRWLRELYPVAELLAARLGGVEVDVALRPAATEVATADATAVTVDAEAPTYRAAFLDADGGVLLERDLTPIVAVAPHPAGGEVLVVSGGVRLRRAGGIVAAERVASDAEAFWHWFVGEVLPALTRDVAADAMPATEEIAVVASLSEPDDVLPLDHETDSVLEVLHEEVTFGVLEAFERACGGSAPRTLGVGRVLPFFRAAPRAPLRARVTVRGRGSERLGVLGRDGAWISAPSCDARVVVRALHGRDERPTGVEIAVLGEAAAARAARSRLRWSAALPDAPLPRGVAVRLGGGLARRPRTARGAGELAALPAASSPALPERPLHPHEVVRHARAFGARRGAARVATPRETALGQPLVVIEVVDPERAAMSRARASAWRPTLLVSARQHANEATSAQAVLRWLEAWLRDPALHRRANLVLHPLENPDGARLHAACCALAPNHMHHAARYTAFGADLQANPRVRGEILAESLMRHDAARRWRPVAHLNDHGYPAHAWVRSLSGFVPRGFGDWSLPTGQLTILTTHGDDAGAAEDLRERLAAAVAAALSADAALDRHTRAQIARSGRYRSAPATPTSLRSGFPFWSNQRPAAPLAAPVPMVRDGPDRHGPLHALAPLVTLITEAPDETVAGEAWRRCVRAHETVNDAVARALLAWLER